LTSEEFARLGDALRLAGTTGLPWQVDETKPAARGAPKAENRSRTLDLFAVAAIRLLILTGARLREILDAQWQHVDLERSVIFLPDSRSISRRRLSKCSPACPASKAAYHSGRKGRSAESRSEKSKGRFRFSKTLTGRNKFPRAGFS
jgi:integrase